MSPDANTTGATPSWNEIEDLFFKALELEPSERIAYLEQATDSVALRREVADMLASERAPEMAIERLLVEASPLASDEQLPPRRLEVSSSLVGSVMGPYTLTRVLGRGGMGEVYLAERSDQQFQRQVAIKLMGLGEASRSAELLERFDQERRVLAQLQHPGIAQLIDAGSLPDGRPYLVMEYVAGQPITDFCDQNQLDIEARQRLFQSVCEVVQFAHSRLVIHRDLKPNNIMVVEGENSEPTVKLLDFGIAKLLQPGLLDINQLNTRTSARPMTPLFAAPEQFAGEVLTTATDVYALGVLFYLLLTGATPFDRSESAADYERLVRKGTPKRLSEALTSSKDNDASTAVALRSTSLERLVKLLGGDVERIAAKALHQDPERRYSSAGQLGEDVNRALRGEAVLAQDDTWAYRLKVFVRRNRPAVMATAATVVSLLILSGFLLQQTLRAQAALALAEEESQRSSRVTEVLANLFSTADPRAQAVGDQIPVSEFLDRVAAAVDQLDDDAQLQTELLSILGRIHLGRDEGQQALSVLSKASAAHRVANADRPTSNAVITEQLELDHALAKATGSVDKNKGIEMLRASLAAHEATYGSGHRRTARAMTDLAQFLDPNSSIPLLNRALEILRAPANPASLSDHSHHERSLDMARALVQRARLHKWSGLLEQSHADSTAAVELLERELGRDHPETLSALHQLSDSLPQSQSMDLLRDLIPRQERVFGSTSASLSASLNTLGEHLVRLGEIEEAKEAWTRAIAIMTQLYGAESDQLMNTSRNLAMLQGLLGDYAEAATLLSQIERRLPDGERSRAYVGIQAAFMRGRAAPSARALELELERIAEAVATLDRIRASEKDNYPARARGLWVRLLLQAGDSAQALKEAETAYSDLASFLPEEHRLMVEAAFDRARARFAVLAPDAEPELRQQLERLSALPFQERFEIEAARRQLGDI